MIDQPLDNLTLRQFRRANFSIGLLYDTPIATMQAICEDIRQAIAEHDLTKSEPGVVHFTDFGESSLNILVLYFVESSDWGEYMRLKEAVNYRIIEIVKSHGADFAFPTRTIHVEELEKSFLVKERN